MTRRTIGFDLAIRGDQVAQIFEDGRPTGKPIRFRVDPASLDCFVARATTGLPAGATVQALTEPTGMSWFPIAHRLADSGVEVIRVKSQRVRALRRYLFEHAKTDLTDAHVLGAMPLFGGPRFDPVHIPTPKSHALQRLTKQRARFQDAVASRRRLLDLVRWASPGIETVLPDLNTRLSLALQWNWFDPAAVLKAADPDPLHQPERQRQPSALRPLRRDARRGPEASRPRRSGASSRSRRLRRTAGRGRPR